eukprot:7397462-Lingulodinium_polyedra.AAC.1
MLAARSRRPANRPPTEALPRSRAAGALMGMHLRSRSAARGCRLRCNLPARGCRGCCDGLGRRASNL